MLAKACTGVPDVNVKDRWSRALVNYSFVPLYPARGGINIGEIRIHRIKGFGATLDSRLFYTSEEAKFFTKLPEEYPAILPGIETFQLTRLNAEKLLRPKLLRDLFGTNLESYASLTLSLGKLTTAETSDRLIAEKFWQHLEKQRLNPEFVSGLCAAAITLNDASLDDIVISVVTRVIRAGAVTYVSANGYSTEPGRAIGPDAKEENDGTEPDADAAQPVLQKNAAIRTTRNVVTSLTATDIPPVTIGVDALTTTPRKLYARDSLNGGKSYLKTVCKGEAKKFIPAQLDALRARLKI